jgi:hypothetical protein
MAVIELGSGGSGPQGPAGAGFTYSVVDYGADPTGVSDSAAAINACNTAAVAAGGNGGTVYFPPGTYYIASKITLTTHVWAQEAQINTDQDITAIQLGDGTTIFKNKIIYLPNVTNTAKTTLGWSGTSIGVKIVNAYQNQIFVGQIYKFVTGLMLTSTGAQGNVYNNYYLGTLWDNQTQLLITPGAVTSWVNENNIYGGRFLFNTAELQAPNTAQTGQPGCRDIYIKMYPDDASHIPDNNVFYKPDLEGNVPQYHVECQGFQNYINHARWESSYPKVYFSSYSATKASKANQINLGYNSENIVYSEDANANYNSVITNGTKRMNSYGAGADGVMIMQNNSSSAYPVLVGIQAQAAGQELSVNPQTAYQFAISANESKYKTATDTYHRLKMDHRLGRLYFGLGLADTTAYFVSSNGTNLEYVGGNLAIAADTPKLNLIDNNLIGSTGAPSITWGDTGDSNQALIGFTASSHNFRMGATTSATQANTILTDSLGDNALLALGTMAVGAASNPSGHKILGHGSSTGTSGPGISPAVTLAIRNTSATNNNYEGLAFLNSNATPGAVAGIDGQNVNHNTSGSQTGRLKLWTSNSGTKTYGLTIDESQNVVITGTVGASNLSGTNTGDQTITLTGAVTGSGTGSFATTLASDIVSHTNLASSVEKFADLTLTHNQIIALNSTPVQIIASPGNGFCIQVTNVYATATFVSVAYTSAGSVILCPTGFTGITLATLGTDLIPAAASLAKSGAPASNPICKPATSVSVFCGTGNPTGASADTVIKIRVFYRVLPFPLP